MMGNDFKVPRKIPLIPISRPVKPAVRHTGKPKSEFGDILQQKIDSSSLKFSAHAQKRMTANRVSLSDNQIFELEQAVKKVEQKGGKESLIVINDLAFVVSISNRTVITAIDQGRMKDNVFTNIDSAVISLKN
ncbi:MAG: flagellar protein [Firmicutes bacterium]|nr:flagellar protein [Bacillota bacterium]